jgi:hypothetical protein
MKIIKFLDQEGTTLVSDPTNLSILRTLVYSEQSVSDLSKTLNIPTLKLWRRIQKLTKANLLELTRTQKVGNLEKKLYRTTATQFIPTQYLNLQPKDPNLKSAYEIYAEIQKQMMNTTIAFGEIPPEEDPIDYAMYVNMQTFAQTCSDPKVQTLIKELTESLEDFKMKK